MSILSSFLLLLVFFVCFSLYGLQACLNVWKCEGLSRIHASTTPKNKPLPARKEPGKAERSHSDTGRGQKHPPKQLTPERTRQNTSHTVRSIHRQAFSRSMQEKTRELTPRLGKRDETFLPPFCFAPSTLSFPLSCFKENA